MPYAKQRRLSGCAHRSHVEDLCFPAFGDVGFAERGQKKTIKSALIPYVRR